MHKSFRQVLRSPFESGYAIVDPGTPVRVARDARRIKRRGLVQLCTTVDAWAPEALEHDLGRRCLEALLAEHGWTVRILTKNAAVKQDYEFFAQHRDRISVGLSITGTPANDDLISAIEPQASSISERIQALRQAYAMGLRTYAMFCPLLPDIGAESECIQELIELAVQCNAEEIFTEPVNPRGPGLKKTQEVLEANGYHQQASAVGRIRQETNWSCYVVDVIQNVQRCVRKQSDMTKLRILVYPSRLKSEDVATVRANDAGVIWL